MRSLDAFADSLQRAACLLPVASQRQAAWEALCAGNVVAEGEAGGVERAEETGAEEGGEGSVSFFGWDARSQRVVPVVRCRVIRGRAEAAAGGRGEGPGWGGEKTLDRLEVVDAVLLDAYVAKVTSLSTAVEAAGAVIRLGDVVVEA